MHLTNLNLLIFQDKLQDGIMTLFISVAIVFMSQIYKKSFFATLILFISLLSLVNLIPLNRGSSLVQLIHGAIGDVSISSGTLLIVMIYKLLANKRRYYILSMAELSLIIIIGTVLYLSAFGFIDFDLYNYGYIENYYILFVFSCSILLLLLFNLSLGYIWLISFIAYYFKLLESHNFWDYLLDPVLWMVVIGNLICRVSLKFKRNN